MCNLDDPKGKYELSLHKNLALEVFESQGILAEIQFIAYTQCQWCKAGVIMNSGTVANDRACWHFYSEKIIIISICGQEGICCCV